MTAMPRNNLQRNADYWAQRMKNMEDALLDQSYSYVENLDAQFRAAEAEIERQMSAWYRRFAANNDITLADAKRLLNSDELAEFRWTVEDYIKHGEENALTGAWMKELENASARVHISRLDALKIQLQQQAELLYSNQLDYIDRAARQSYTGSFYHTAYEVQKGLGVGWTMQAVNEGTITKVLYVLGEGAISFEDIGAKVPYEMARDPKTDGGVDTLYTRQRKVFSPFGISYEKTSQTTLSPTDAELANGANWCLVHSGESDDGDRSYIAHKAIPIARILSRG